MLRAEADRLYATDREEVWRESSGAPRTAFAAHAGTSRFAASARHPRLIRPIEQLLGGKVYMHQYKINAKAAFDGEVWQWHQDYGTWARDDHMPEPLAMNIALFLDEVTRGQRAAAVHPAQPQRGRAGGRARPRHHLLSAVDARPRHGHAPGRAGRHRRAGGRPGSGGHVPRQPRARQPAQHQPLRAGDRLSLAVPGRQPHPPFKRAEWIAHRDFTPIEPLADDCLAELVPTAGVRS